MPIINSSGDDLKLSIETVAVCTGWPDEILSH